MSATDDAPESARFLPDDEAHGTSIQPCGEVRPGWCEANADKLAQACHDLDKPPGSKILLQLDGRICYCVCPGGSTAADAP